MCLVQIKQAQIKFPLSGFWTVYRRFLPAVARILVPLTDVLKGGRKGSEQLEWTEDMQAAFRQSKESLYSGPSRQQSTAGPVGRCFSSTHWSCGTAVVGAGGSVATPRFLLQEVGSCRGEILCL